MCTTCHSWTAMAQHAWDEVFRLMDIVSVLRPYLPVGVQGPIDGTLRIVATDPLQVQQRIQSLAATCERVVSGSARTQLVSSRSDMLNSAAQRAEALHGNIIGPSLQYIQIIRDLDVNLSAGLRYLQMMNSVMDNWIVSMRQQQQNWDMMWVQYKQQQAQIDRIHLDVLTGTPFIKAYLVT